MRAISAVLGQLAVRTQILLVTGFPAEGVVDISVGRR
jgi:hypothetical protein